MNGFQEKQLLEASQNLEQLTEWEQGFVRDLLEKGDGYELSEKQNGIVNRIAQKLGREKNKITQHFINEVSKHGTP